MFQWLKHNAERREQRTEQFFCCAVAASCQKSDEAAAFSALAAGISAQPNIRAGFIQYLGRLVEIYLFRENVEVAKTLCDLAELLSQTKYGKTVYAHLRSEAFEYWIAYKQRDGSFFLRKYPDLKVITVLMARGAFVNLTSGEDIDDPFKDPDIKKALAESHPDIYSRLVALNVVKPGGYTETEYAEAFERMKAEWEFKTAGKPELSLSETQELREYARSKTDLTSNILTADQAVYKLMYESLTSTMREAAPDVMAKLEPIEEKVRTCEVLRDRLMKMETRLPK